MPVRGYKYFTVVIPINTAIGTTITDESGTAYNSIPFHMFASGFVRIPAAWTDADLGLKTCYYNSDAAADYNPAVNSDGGYGSSGTADTKVIDGIATAESKDYDIPWTWFTAAFARLRSVNRSTGNDVNQAAERTIIVGLKT